MTLHSGYALDPPRKKVREKQPTRRASNKGCLPMRDGEEGKQVPEGKQVEGKQVPDT